MNGIGDDVAYEYGSVKLWRKLLGLIDSGTSDAGGAVVISGGQRRIAETIVGLAKAVVIPALQHHRQRL